MSNCAPWIPWTNWPEARMSCGIGDGIAGGSILLLLTGFGDPIPATRQMEDSSKIMLITNKNTWWINKKIFIDSCELRHLHLDHDSFQTKKPHRPVRSSATLPETDAHTHTDTQTRQTNNTVCVLDMKSARFWYKNYVIFCKYVKILIQLWNKMRKYFLIC